MDTVDFQLLRLLVRKYGLNAVIRAAVKAAECSIHPAKLDQLTKFLETWIELSHHAGAQPPFPEDAVEIVRALREIIDNCSSAQTNADVSKCGQT